MDEQRKKKSLTEYAEAFAILAKYDDGQPFAVSAEHDVILSGPANASEVEMSLEDAARLEALGWFIDEEFDCWSVFT